MEVLEQWRPFFQTSYLYGKKPHNPSNISIHNLKENAEQSATG